MLELERADRMRKRLKAAQIIGDRGQPVKLNVIACAIAMSVKDATFKDDREAKGLFRVEKDTKIRRDWIDGGTVKGSWVEAKFKRLAAYEREVRRVKAAERITDVERRALAATAKAAAFRQKRQEQAARKAVSFRAHHLTIPAGARQCEGFTRATGLQCMVHSQCTFADAAPLRRGAAYCRHHDRWPSSRASSAAPSQRRPAAAVKSSAARSIRRRGRSGRPSTARCVTSTGCAAAA